ncbi:Clp protease N-terminal domain-containing protein [Streptomyces sp. NBC_00572]|uniref:Clp protease N-terminal domain-containing protein n=1 Tax=Streptomyces sp. NBC_00572 TaxID=2903664 RepID=UPI00224DB5CA|nr:Clp protease N-terminal domain-containing protein [Streptomyces sp. NBC_00572]MCX4987001.1 peptidase [Streptomyces sp. NBC_00572]
MHHPVPIPQQPLRQPAAPAAPRAELAPFLAPSLRAVVTGARRRALRDGDRQIDTAHLLHSLIESDSDVGAVFEGGHQPARVLGYLAQRSIGYGLRWQRSVEDSGARRLLPAAREAEPQDARASGWSPAASAALEEAFRRAAERGETQARGLDLLAVIAADPESRAVEVLRRAGVDPVALAARAEAAADPRIDPGVDPRIDPCVDDRVDVGTAPLAEGSVPRSEGEPSQQV